MTTPFSTPPKTPRHSNPARYPSSAVALSSCLPPCGTRFRVANDGCPRQVIHGNQHPAQPKTLPRGPNMLYDGYKGTKMSLPTCLSRAENFAWSLAWQVAAWRCGERTTSRSLSWIFPRLMWRALPSPCLVWLWLLGWRGRASRFELPFRRGVEVTDA